MGSDSPAPLAAGELRGRALISGSVSLHEVHQLRSRVDAIVTGVGTVLHDDPRLTVRLPKEADAAPIAGPERVVLDSWLRTPPGARLFEPPDEGERGGQVHILAHPGPDPIRRRALESAGARVHGGRGMDRHTLDLRDLWTWLDDQGYERVMLEAGPTLLRNASRRGSSIRCAYSDVVAGGRVRVLPRMAALSERFHGSPEASRGAPG